MKSTADEKFAVRSAIVRKLMSSNLQVAYAAITDLLVRKFRLVFRHLGSAPRERLLNADIVCAVVWIIWRLISKVGPLWAPRRWPVVLWKTNILLGICWMEEFSCDVPEK